MKVCFLNNIYPPHSYAGSGMHVYYLANGLVDRGHDVTVVYGLDAFRLKGQGRSQTNLPTNPKINIKQLRSPFGKLAPVVAHQTGRPLLNHSVLTDIFQDRFDVIHYHNVSLLGAPTIYTYGSGVKLATIHDYWLLCPLSTLYKFNREICTQRNCIPCTLHGGRPPQLWRSTGLLRKSLDNIDAFITPSEFIRDLHLKEGFPDRFHYIPNPIPQENDAGMCLGEPAFTEPYFLFAGRLEKTKGVQDLVPIFRNYASAHLVIAGDGSYRKHLEGMTRASTRIHFLGYLDRKSLLSYYRHALALIVPSVWYDNLPTVILDAMALGVPVIARDLAGPGEFVRKSGAGLLFQNETELQNALETVQADGMLRHSLGEKGRQYLRQHHSLDTYLDKYLRLINSLERRNELQNRLGRVARWR